MSDKDSGLPIAIASLLAMGGVAVTIVWGGMNKLATGEKTVEGAWFGDTFATLGWIGVLVLAASTVWAIRNRDENIWGLLSVGIGGQLLFAAGVAGVSLAWGAERQNYWEASQFAILVWNALAGSACAFVCVVLAARRGSGLASFLVGLSTFCLLASLLGWTWTWSSTVQGIEAEITRHFYLATHR